MEPIPPSSPVKNRANQSVTVITCNVRFDGRSGNPVPLPKRGTVQAVRGWLERAWGERPWAERRSRLIDAIAPLEPDVIGFQEVLHSQIDDLRGLLGLHWEYYGVGRDDGKEAGEYSPIFYNTRRFQLVKSQTKWLSTTPDRAGSKGWDAAQTRIATFVTLRDLSSHSPKNRVIHFVNTHYDDQGKRARQNSSLVIRAEAWKWAESWKEDQQAGMILFGDLNSPENEDGYKSLVSLHPLPYKIPSMFFQDTYFNLLERGRPMAGPPLGEADELVVATRLSAPAGPWGTFTDFAAPGHEEDERIDMVFLAVTQKDDYANTKGSSEEASTYPEARGGLIPVKFLVVDNLIAGRGDRTGWTGRWSDHRAVMVKFAILGTDE